jgi:glycosyltransferase 2 family protein
MKKTVLHGIFGVGFGALCLWLALNQISLDDIQTSLSKLEYKWILLAAVLYCVNMSVRVVRWQILLRPTIRLSYLQVSAALIVGYMVNNLLPARLGELYRADYMKRKHGITRSAALGSIVVERLLDGIAIVLIFNTGLLFTIVPSESSTTLITISVLATLLFAGLFVFVRFISFFRKYIARIPVSWLNSRLDSFAETLKIVQHPAILFPGAITVVVYMLEAATLACSLKSGGIELSLFQNFVVLGAVVLGTLVPTAPGYVGSIQLAFVITLGAFGTDASQAFVAATAFQVFPLLIVVICGMSIIASQTLRSVASTK